MLGKFLIYWFYFCSTCKLECGAHVRLKANRLRQELVVTELFLQHNHDLSKSAFLHLPENRRIDKEDEEILLPLTELHIPPSRLVNLIHSKTNKPVTTQDVHNTIRRIIGTHGKTDVELLAEEVDKLVGQGKLLQPVLRIGDSSNMLKIFFFQTPYMKEVFLKFPEVLLIDATYRTNKLKMPLFVFVVEDGNGVGVVVAYCFVADEQQHTITEMMEIFLSCNAEASSTEVCSELYSKRINIVLIATIALDFFGDSPATAIVCLVNWVSSLHGSSTSSQLLSAYSPVAIASLKTFPGLFVRCQSSSF